MGGRQGTGILGALQWIGAAVAIGFQQYWLAAALFISGTTGVVTAFTMQEPGLEDLTGPSIKDNGHLLNTRKSDAVLAVIYGTFRAGGNLVYVNSTGDNNKYLHLIMTLSEGEVDSVLTDGDGDKIWLNDRRIQEFTDAGNPDLDEDYVWWTVKAGASDQTAISISGDSNWTDPLHYTAYIYFRLLYNRDLFTGLPKLTAELKGRKIYDPRDQTTVYSSNPILVLWDYLTNTRYGRGLDSSLLDIDTFKDAANWCDDNQYYFNGALLDKASFLDNVNRILATCRGGLIWSDGKFKVLIMDYDPPVMTLDEDNITADSWQTKIPSLQDTPNIIKVNFPDVDQDYVTNDFKTEQPSVLANNEDRRETELTLIGTTDYEQAYKLGVYNLERQGFNIVHGFIAGSKAIPLEPGDMIEVVHSLPGWTDGKQESLNEGDFTTHAKWDKGGDFDDSGGNAAYSHSTGSGVLLQTSGKMAVPGVANKAYKFTYTVSGASGTPSARITMTFANKTKYLDLSDGTHILLFQANSSPGNFNISATSISGDAFTLDDLSLLEMVQVVRVIDSRILSNEEVQLTVIEELESLYDDELNVSSHTKSVTNLPDPLAVPPSVENYTSQEETYPEGDVTFVRLKVTFDQPTDYPFWDYAEIWISLDGTNYSHFTDAVGGFTIEKVTVGQQYWIKMISVSSYGVKEDFDTAPTIYTTILGLNAPPADVSSLNLSVHGNVVNLNWLPVSDTDLRYYEFRTGGSSWAQSYLLARTKGRNYSQAGVKPGMHIFWMKALDNTGHFSSNAISATVKIPLPLGMTEQSGSPTADDFSGGTHNNTQRYNHGTYGWVLRVDHTGGLSGDYTTPLLNTLGSATQRLHWLEFTVYIVGTGGKWTDVFSPGDSWTDKLTAGMTWLDLFGGDYAGDLDIIFMYSEDNIVWYEANLFYILGIQVDARYKKVKIKINDNVQNNYLLIDDPITLKEYA